MFKAGDRVRINPHYLEYLKMRFNYSPTGDAHAIVRYHPRQPHIFLAELQDGPQIVIHEIWLEPLPAPDERSESS